MTTTTITQHICDMSGQLVDSLPDPFDEVGGEGASEDLSITFLGETIAYGDVCAACRVMVAKLITGLEERKTCYVSQARGNGEESSDA